MWETLMSEFEQPQCGILVRYTVFGLAAADGADFTKTVDQTYLTTQARRGYLGRVYKALHQAGIAQNATPPPELTPGCVGKSFEWVTNEIKADLC